MRAVERGRGAAPGERSGGRGAAASGPAGGAAAGARTAAGSAAAPGALRAPARASAPAAAAGERPAGGSGAPRRRAALGGLTRSSGSVRCCSADHRSGHSLSSSCTPGTNLVLEFSPSPRAGGRVTVNPILQMRKPKFRKVTLTQGQRGRRGEIQPLDIYELNETMN